MYRCNGGFFSTHTDTSTPPLWMKKKAPDLIRFFLFITLISIPLLSPLQMRGRWGGSGFDDLKCVQLTRYSYPRVGNLTASSPFALLFSWCLLVKEGKVARGLTSAPLSRRRSFSLSSKDGHSFHPLPRFTARSRLKVAHLSGNLWPTACNSFPAVGVPSNSSNKGNTHLIAVSLCAELWAHFYARLYTCALHYCPSVTVQLWSEEKKCRHRSYRADCRPGRVNFAWISIPVIGRSQLASTNTDTGAAVL